METILTSRAFGMISGADIDNRYDIHFEFDKIVQESKEELVELEDVFHISLGGYSKLDVKLEYIVKALLKEDLEGAVGGSIDVSEVGNRVSIRPSFSLDEEEDEITDEETMPDEENTPDTDYDGPVGTPGVAG
jgi:hypothetical protein